MQKGIYLLLLLLLAVSCNDKRVERGDAFTLVGENVYLKYQLNDETKLNIRTLFPYQDESGKDYLTFQNPDANEIFVYPMDSSSLAFKISPETEGANGVGRFVGYYIKDFNNIFITSPGKPELALIDYKGVVKKRIKYEESADIPINPALAMSFAYKPIIEVGNKMYILSQCNRMAAQNPVSAIMDMETNQIKALPFSYPFFPASNDKRKAYGVESDFSRCCDGAQFVYSFNFKENIYVASLSHDSVREIAVRSKYIDEVVTPDENSNLGFKQMLKLMCESPNYGNLIYDKYRRVYYRVAYPKTEIEPDENCMDVWQYGRKLFSLIILDADFNIVGETLLPEYTYNSTLMFVREDGLYICESNVMNPAFNENELVFRRFELLRGVK